MNHEGRLLTMIRYAGSDAGRSAYDSMLAELARLHAIEAAAWEVASTIHLNDAGPEAFATMATLRDVLRPPHATAEGKK